MALAVLIQLRFFKKEGKIVTAVYTEQRLESREDIGFAPIGLDEPYRIVVGNNPVNFVDPLGLFSVDDAASASIEGYKH
jgi:hypothetical protein